MTDPAGPQNDQTASVPGATSEPIPGAEPIAPAAPIVPPEPPEPPAAGYGAPYTPPAAAPAYEPPTYPGSPYAAPASPYGAPSASSSPYGTPQPGAYGATPSSPYGPPPPNAYGAANVYGAAPANAYGAAPGNAYAAPPTTAYGATPAPYGYVPARKTNGLAIASFASSLGGLVLSWTGVLALGLIVGIVLGHVSLGQIRRTGEGGRGFALAGVIIGWVCVGIAVLFLLLGALLWGTSWRRYY